MTARILVVDDDVALAEMISIVLRGEGYTPIQAFDGHSALLQISEAKPDLILLDVMLPGLDGIEVCSRIRESSGVPIIMLTARGDTTDVVRGLESGADDYVVKPFNPKELVARIKTMFEGWQLAAYLETAKKSEPFDPALFEGDDEYSPEEIEDNRKQDIRQCTRDLLLVERAREWLLDEAET